MIHCNFPALLDIGSQVCTFSGMVRNSDVSKLEFPIFWVTGERISEALKNKFKITHQVLLTFKMYIPTLLHFNLNFSIFRIYCTWVEFPSYAHMMIHV